MLRRGRRPKRIDDKRGQGTATNPRNEPAPWCCLPAPPPAHRLRRIAGAADLQRSARSAVSSDARPPPARQWRRVIRKPSAASRRTTFIDELPRTPPTMTTTRPLQQREQPPLLPAQRPRGQWRQTGAASACCRGTGASRNGCRQASTWQPRAGAPLQAEPRSPAAVRRQRSRGLTGNHVTYPSAWYDGVSVVILCLFAE